MDNGGFNDPSREAFDITEPSTNLAKKYDGYRYSVSPLKQTCETVMVFKKPNKSGSVLHDTLAMEYGDDTITCSALNIDGNRVPATDKAIFPVGDYGESNFRNNERTEDPSPDGRYPSQTFVDSEAAEKLDLQSGVHFADIGGCSKILHKCDYEQIDFDLFIYEPKVNSRERNNGLDDMEEK